MCVCCLSEEDHKPSFFQLRDGNTSACLASSFSKHKAVEESYYEGLFKGTEASRISGSGLYNQVALLEPTEKGCVDGSGVPDGCEGDLKPDPTVNTLSLTVLGLRLLFLKTVVFNVLLTLRLWSSH